MRSYFCSGVATGKLQACGDVESSSEEKTREKKVAEGATEITKVNRHIIMHTYLTYMPHSCGRDREGLFLYSDVDIIPHAY